MPEVAAPSSMADLINQIMPPSEESDTPEEMPVEREIPDPPLPPQPAPKAPAPAPEAPVAPPAPLPVAEPSAIPPDALFAPPVPKVEVEEFPEEPHPGASEKSKSAWKTLRDAHYSTKSKLAEAEKRLQLSQTPQQDESAKARIADLEAQLSQLSPIVERANIEAHPEFIKQFDQPRQRIMTDLQSVIQMAELDPSEFQGVLNSSGKARIQAIDELSETITSPTLRSRLTQLGSDLERLDAERTAVVKNSKMWKEQADAQMQVEQHRQIEAQKTHWSNVLNSTVDAMSEQFELLREVEGNEGWNAQVRERRKQAQFILTENTDPKQVAAAAVLAPMAVGYRAWALSERAAKMELQKELETLKGSRPNLRDGSSDSPVEHGDPDRPMATIFGNLYNDLKGQP